MTSQKLPLDLNDIAAGRVELATFQERLSAFDLSPYQNKHVQLKGCAPTWAHLLVAAKLWPIVSGLDFLVDDKKEGQAVEIIKPLGPSV